MVVTSDKSRAKGACSTAVDCASVTLGESLPIWLCRNMLPRVEDCRLACMLFLARTRRTKEQLLQHLRASRSTRHSRSCKPNQAHPARNTSFSPTPSLREWSETSMVKVGPSPFRASLQRAENLSASSLMELKLSLNASLSLAADLADALAAKRATKKATVFMLLWVGVLSYSEKLEVWWLIV